jgi:Predicted exporters of the RND superfamily
MERFFKTVLNHPKSVIFIFLIASGICLITSNFVGVNYVISDYLPQTSKSTIAFEVMEEEYGFDVPNMRIMVPDVTIAEALKIKEQLVELNSVVSVMWLDDAANIYVPFDTIDKGALDSYYKDNNALFVLTTDGVYEELIVLLENIHNIAGEDCLVSGQKVDDTYAQLYTVSEIRTSTVLSVLVCLIILFLFSHSWIEPIIFMVTIGMAIVLNMGTNIMFDEISFVTNASASVLQLGVSMDYSIMLLHSYVELKKDGESDFRTILKALQLTFKAVSSSSLTDMFGFISFLFMRFGIGVDLGIVLLKGVMLSAICVLVFMPVVLLKLSKVVEKTQHKPLFGKFKRLGKFVSKTKYITVALFIILLIPAFLSSNMNHYLYGSSEMFKDSVDFVQERDIVDETFGKSNLFVLMVPKGDFVKEYELSSDLKKIPQVSSIISYVDMVGAEIPMEFLDKSVISQLISENYSRMILDVKTDFEGIESFEVVEEIRLLAENYYGDNYHMTGSSVITYDLRDTIEADNVRVNIIATVSVFLIIMIAFKSISIPIILVLVIQGAIWVNMALPYYMGNSVYYLSYLIISTLQLAATIDYAILFTDKYISYRTQYSRAKALHETIANVTSAIVVSAAILVFAGLLIALVSSNALLAQLGMFIGIGTTISFIFVIFILPGMLYIFDKFIQKTTLGLNFNNEKKEKKSK